MELDQKEGVWDLIKKNSPPQEIDEITQTIGYLKIEDNNDLWREMLALKSILLDAGSNNFDSPIRLNKKSKFASKKSIINAQIFSNLHYQEELSNISPEIQFILNLKTFNLETINKNIDIIKIAFDKEKYFLEQEITKLNQLFENQLNLESDSDKVGKVNNSLDNPNPSGFCARCKYSIKISMQEKKGVPKKFPSLSNKIEPHTDNESIEKIVSGCPICNVHGNLKLSESFPAGMTLDNSMCDKYFQEDKDSIDHIDNKISIDSSPGSSLASKPQISPDSKVTESKFRTRLNLARNELYFQEGFD